MRLRVNKDLSTTYLPSSGEVEALVCERTINNPLYHYTFERANNRLEIVYRQEVKRLHGIPLYHLKYFVVQNNYFDLSGFKHFFKVCFPQANVSALSKSEAQELCQQFIEHMKQKVN